MSMKRNILFASVFGAVFAFGRLAHGQGVTPGYGTLGSQNANAVAITGGAITGLSTLGTTGPLNLSGTSTAITDLTHGVGFSSTTDGINYFNSGIGVIVASGHNLTVYVNGAVKLQVDQFGSTHISGHTIQTVSDGLTANGTTCGTGTAPPADDDTYTTVGSAASVTLVNIGAGGQTTIRNRGLNALTVCPFSTGAIETGVVGTGSVSISVGADATFKQTTATQVRQ
jgi:hypothetical protein